MSIRNNVVQRHDPRRALVSSNLLPRRSPANRPARRWIIWAISIGIFLPYTFGDTGKYIVSLFFLPAMFVFISSLSREKRKLMAADIFVWATILWMVVVKVASLETDANLLFKTASDALALVASYMAARSFFYGEHSVNEFVRALKFIAIAVIVLSVLDTLSGKHITNELVKTFFNTPLPDRPEAVEIHRNLFGIRVLRAESIFPHPILYGIFCSLAATIFVHLERSITQRIFFFGICLFGCLLSVSSAAVLGFVILVAVYSYDCVLGSYSARWKIFTIVTTATFAASFIVSNNPITWLLRHATIDPADGYYRLLIWTDAFDYIVRSPIVGADFSSWASNDILSNTIDSVWLVLALTYGVPMIILLFLANLFACGIFGKKFNRRPIDHEILRSRTAFSLVLFLFVSLGITVHFWSSIWLFWGLCIGIRTSLEEYYLADPSQKSSPKNLRPGLLPVRLTPA